MSPSVQMAAALRVAKVLIKATRDHCDRAYSSSVITQIDAALSAHEAEVKSSNERMFPEPGTEQEARFKAIEGLIRQRIEDGNVDAEDIPVLMVRYGMNDPQAFEVEMLERMAEATEEDEEEAEAHAGLPPVKPDPDEEERILSGLELHDGR